MKPLPMSEKNTVDRAIEIEDRMLELGSERERLEEELNEYSMHPIDRLGEIEAEMADLYREYRG